MKYLIIFLVSLFFLFPQLYAAQIIDNTKGRYIIQVLTNMVFVTNDNKISRKVEITTNFVYDSKSNVEYSESDEPRLPNTYLKTGKIEVVEPESPLRRFDVVFFVSIPITYYLTQNIMMMKNQFFENNRALSDADNWYIALNTLIIPFFVAFSDYFYIEKQKSLRESYAAQSDKSVTEGIGVGVKYAILF